MTDLSAAELAAIRERHDAITQEPLVDACGDCTNGSMCLACLGDLAFHTARDHDSPKENE